MESHVIIINIEWTFGEAAEVSRERRPCPWLPEEPLKCAKRMLQTVPNCCNAKWDWLDGLKLTGTSSLHKSMLAWEKRDTRTRMRKLLRMNSGPMTHIVDVTKCTMV
ncbi:hypothetical protein RRG08_016973 [Elysia crispata]|uniref:Uncharacterized protein n=1 Tax=Elysia crispata TaxID=231223 RepID=A0AAE1CPH4_9GAST|nr:hypothetical protein RRG08_016973 [Elysia crispata]